MSLSVSAGGLVSLSPNTDTKLVPTILLEVNSKLAESEYTPVLDVNANLSGLPGSSLTLSDPTTFTSLEFKAGLEQSIPNIYPRLYAGFGLATRLPGDTDPRINVPKYFTFGVLFTTTDRTSYLYVGGGPDQRLSNSYIYEPNVHIIGKVKLTSVSNAKMFLIGDAILGSKTSSVRIGITVGI
jgi:hypothetical protein